MVGAGGVAVGVVAWAVEVRVVDPVLIDGSAEFVGRLETLLRGSPNPGFAGSFVEPSQLRSRGRRKL